MISQLQVVPITIRFEIQLMQTPAAPHVVHKVDGHGRQIPESR